MFYLFFRSKENILEAVAEKNCIPHAEDVKNITKGNEDSATKVNSILNSILKANYPNLGILKLLHQKGNYLFHQKVKEALEAGISLIVTEVLA